VSYEEIWKKAAKEVAKQRDKYKTERDTCLEDIEKLRERNKELERENRDLKHENKALRLQADTYFDEWQNAETYIDAIKTYYPMYEKLRKQYTTLTNHIRLKAEANPGVSRYIDLVNYIDRLERD
jgi:DNA repair exonuclease SbcCD ATPase subunit